MTSETQEARSLNSEGDAPETWQGCLPASFPPSANGYLIVDGNGKAHRAAWAAPFFVFVGPESPEDDALGLIHCETLEDARRARRNTGGTILDHQLLTLA